MTRFAVRWIVVAAAAALLAGCSLFAAPTPAVDGAATLAAAAKQTQDAVMEAARLTAEAKLSQGQTPTLTLPPAATRTPRPTETNTAIIRLSPTPTASATVTPSATNTPAPFQCKLVGQDPVDGATMKINSKVTILWTVRNLGPATWEKEYFDLVQVGGDQIAEKSILDLPKTVKPGEEVELVVVLKVGDVTGKYRTDWKLLRIDDNFTFCPLYAEFWVKE